jgi:mannose/cellobiose epimerase-like protein (N-acyl-D-glucosamine 2-epimerase family)
MIPIPSCCSRLLALGLLAAALPAASVSCPELQEPDRLRADVVAWADWWLDHAYDPATGRCWARIDRMGNRKDLREASLIQARNAYAMTRAFMITGDAAYLTAARKMLDYLEQKFWDPVGGGYLSFTYASGAKAGQVEPTAIRTAVQQHYCQLGTIAFVEATGDAEMLARHQRGRDLMQERMWDARPAYEGYFERWFTDGRAATGKGFGPTVDGITTHHLAERLVLGD